MEHVRKLQSQLSESQRQCEQCVVREATVEQELREKVERLGTVQRQVMPIILIVNLHPLIDYQ